jgi:uncharacterized protein with NAD-binding domain and iron-sulfur cluster
MARKKVIVLGGGTGSLAAVWGLTGLPNWQDDYEITVYQMGWRLGGKGASGRNHAQHDRIEEHGLHIWGGFYDNAFRVMRECYAELNRPPGSPLATWRDAFHEHSSIMFEEYVGGRWVHWPITFPLRDDTPGDGKAAPTPWELIKEMIALLINLIKNSDVYGGPDELEPRPEALWELITKGDNDPATLDIAGFSVPGIFQVIRDFSEGLANEAIDHLLPEHARLFRLLERARSQLDADFQGQLDDNDLARRLYYALDLGLAVINGMIRTGAVIRGWQSIDDSELGDWLKRWGASQYTVDSSIVRGIYDYVFAYLRGDADLQTLAAGTALQGILRLATGYSGAFFYEMQAGMGDVVFTPLYEVLKRRGVKFVFFHRVESLEVTPDGKSIASVRFTKQANLASGNLDDYQPFVDVKGLPCWPSDPNWSELVDGAAMQAAGVNFESRWSAWPGIGQVELVAGVDFDHVINGTSVAEHKNICKPLMAANARYRHMVEGLRSVQTQSAQLWFTVTPEQAGAPNPPVIATAYAKPLDTWADMSFLIPHESWGADPEVKFLTYLCSAFPDATVIPPYTDHDFPARERARVEANMVDWLTRSAGHVWPGITDPNNPAGIDWSTLWGPEAGALKLKSQYLRANIDPTERYVMSTPGTTKLRLKADESGFSNLTLCGDWIYTSLAAGCVESAVMSGLHAAEAVSGVRMDITDGYER